MRKFAILLIITLLFSMATAGFAQQKSKSKAVSNTGKSVEQGTKLVYAGLGLGWGGVGYHMRVPPLFGGFEYVVKFAPKVPISFGGTIAYAQYYYDFLSYEFGDHYLIIDGRAAYHFTELIPNKKLMEKLDLYAGVALGLRMSFISVSDNYPTTYSGDTVLPYFYYGVYAGARWFFNDFVGAFAELGVGYAIINGGVVFKF